MILTILMMFDHTEGLKPIEHNVPWYYVALAVLVGAALLVHGAKLAFTRWERDLGGPRWVDIAGEVFGIILATTLGGIAGHVVWNWALGGMVALVGAFSSSFVVSLVRARFGAAKEALKEASSSADDKKQP